MTIPPGSYTRETLPEISERAKQMVREIRASAEKRRQMQEGQPRKPRKQGKPQGLILTDSGKPQGLILTDSMP